MKISWKDFGGGANRDLREIGPRFEKEYRSLLLPAYYSFVRIGIRIPLAGKEAIAHIGDDVDLDVIGHRQSRA